MHWYPLIRGLLIYSFSRYGMFYNLKNFFEFYTFPKWLNITFFTKHIFLWIRPYSITKLVSSTSLYIWHFSTFFICNFMSEDKNCMALKKTALFKNISTYVRGYNFIFSLVLNRYESHHYENWAGVKKVSADDPYSNI